MEGGDMTEETKDEASQTATAAGAGAANDAGKATGAPASPKKKKNGWMVLGIVVAVIAVVAIAFNIWHNQPSFCNAICHSPMDNYVASYNSDNEGMMAVVHRKAGVSCLSCHEARTGEQIQEVGMWIDGSYPLDEYGNLANADANNMASEAFCLKSGCHDWNTVVANTWGVAGNDEKYNPHSSHQDGAVECGDCHKSHSTSEFYCAKCHAINVPDGWEATSE
jgi:hypothetical protein